MLGAAHASGREHQRRQRRGARAYPKVRPFLEHPFEQHKEEIGIDVPLVHLVDNDVCHVGQLGILLQLIQDNTRCAVLDRTVRPRPLSLVPHRVSNGIAGGLIALICDPPRYRHCRDSPRLCDKNVDIRPASCFDCVVQNVPEKEQERAELAMVRGLSHAST
jgi:hypothetical protein